LLLLKVLTNFENPSSNPLQRPFKLGSNFKEANKKVIIVKGSKKL
jgi:hypothetical protein